MTETPSTLPDVLDAPQMPVPRDPGAISVGDFVALAMQRGDLDLVERAFRLKREIDADEARKAFTVAMAEFKSEPLEIFKRKQVAFSSTKGNVSYKHAELEDVVAAIAPALARHGLSHRWEPTQEGGQVSVSTIVTHVGGHSERVTLSGPKDDSGLKNPIQAVGSTITYLSRYGLLSICGMATKEDDDGRGSSAQEEEADPVLDELRAASMNGEAALRAAFAKLGPGSDAKGKPKPWPLWERQGASLKAAAAKADADAKAAAA